jgi:hypothetical protein
LPGDDLRLSITPYAGAQRLLGEPEADFAASGGAITVLDTGRPNERRVVAREPGTATLTVSALGQTATVEVEVLP